MVEQQTTRAPDSAAGYDPLDAHHYPELYEGVLARRATAFLVDVVIITLPVLLAGLFIFLFGLITLGLGWGLFWLLSPAAMIWAIAYYATTLGGPRAATLGMRLVNIEMRTWYAARPSPLIAAVHAIAYWISVSTLTPLVLVVAFFNQRRRLLHDFLLGSVVINTPPQAAPFPPRASFR